jgi:hypothetical protein
MRRRLISQRVLFGLIAAAAILIIGGFVALALGRLLEALGDQPGSRALDYVALACGALFVIDLVCLVLAQALNGLDNPDDPPDAE